MEQKYIVALETGSSKIRGAIGCVDDSGILTVKAVEEERLIDCVRYGCVRNVGEVSQAITNILQRLEAREPGRKITGVYTAIGGKSTMLSVCRVERRLPVETEVTDEHLRQLAEEARSTALAEREIIAVTPRRFSVDKFVTRNPVGTFGESIEAVYNLVSCKSQLKRNLNNVLSRSNIQVYGRVVRQLAVADLVLTSEEKRLGCILVDFGAETVTVSCYKDGVLRYLATLPMGSRNITLDITSLHHLEENAERLKKTIGTAEPAATDLSMDSADYSDINNIIGARVGEIIANIAEQIKYADCTTADFPAGIILTGGGAKLKGFSSRLEKATRLKVRIGLPGHNVRMADSRIQPVDAVDVIAILAAVAAKGRSCMTEPEPVREPEPEPEHNHEPVSDRLADNRHDRRPRFEPEPEDDPLEGLEDDPMPRGRRSSILDKIKVKMARLMEHADDDGDDDFDELNR